MPLSAKDAVASSKKTGQGNVSFARSLLPTLLSVGLFALCAPGRPFPWLAWVCMVPMLSQLRQTTVWRGLFFAGIFGWLMWFTSVWWLYAPLHDMLGMPILGSLLFIFVGCGWLALPYALAGAIICRWPRSSGIFGAARDAAVFTTAITWLTPIFQGSIAHTQYRYPIVLQILELGGTPLLLFLIFWVNALLAEGLLQWRNKHSPRKLLLGAIMVLGVVLFYGGIRLQQFAGVMKAAPNENWFTVGAIQPNIPIQVDAQRQPSSGSAGNDFYSAIQQAHDLFQKHPEVDLFALPENPATFLFNQDAGRRQTVGKLITETHRPVMINADAFDPAKAAESIPERYNVALWMDANHNLASSYAKIERVPVVEYLPGEKMFPWLRQWFPKSQRVLQGSGPVVFEIKPNIKVIPLICYEGTGSSLTRQFIRKGGNIIINQVNDSWFLRTPASEIHLALTLFRTVEYRVPLVRVTNSGVGAHIQADGRIVPGSRTDLFKKTETAFPLYVPASRSVYAMIGNWWMLLFFGLVFLSRSHIKGCTTKNL